jgi:hypothetical protein
MFPEQRPYFRALAEFLACPFVLFLGFLNIFKKQSGRSFDMNLLDILCASPSGRI